VRALDGESAAAVKTLFDELPPLNRVVIARLVNFLQQLAYPENQAVNKVARVVSMCAC
jgi:hypothetical protein